MLRNHHAAAQHGLTYPLICHFEGQALLHRASNQVDAARAACTMCCLLASPAPHPSEAVVDGDWESMQPGGSWQMHCKLERRHGMEKVARSRLARSSLSRVWSHCLGTSACQARTNNWPHLKKLFKSRSSEDCTTTQVSGCSDMVQGWVDSVGRDCPTYAARHEGL